ncbi:hypothetical protein TARUN_7967 [Trichoderma arundinaceum]|uniref:Uncharacterized protein n=1 Tax=Trichoderma arundinaceum TaxID=490622 RepID=A0A395NE97_TRIAR|nr:hypothetical protein TARUN_7967 [Trichoderma arundinaceum]
MKACCLSLPAFFGLSALATAEALPPDAVPVMCAAICGPIVELSSMCSPKRSVDRETHLRQAREDDGRQVEENEQIEKRFSVIVPAPTTFPPGLLESLYSSVSSQTPVPPVPPVSWPQPSPSPYAPIVPSQSLAPIAPPTYSQPVQPPPAQAPPSTANNLLQTTPQPAPPSPTSPTSSNTKISHLPANALTSSIHHTSTAPTIIGSDGNNGQTGGWGVKENAEEKCVCLNDSFNVAEIAGLCASCISMNADTQNSEF